MVFYLSELKMRNLSTIVYKKLNSNYNITDLLLQKSYSLENSIWIYKRSNWKNKI